jgi:GNAT superfamily N-acetyltransferase
VEERPSPGVSAAAVPEILPGGGPRFTLEATRAGSLVARLQARRPVPSLVVADRVECVQGGAESEATAAIAASLAAFAATHGREILLVDRATTAALHAALTAAGLRVVRRKAFVERSLTTSLPPVPEGLSARSLADVGEDEFVARMTECSEGDPFEERQGTERDPKREWRELVEHAGPRFDASRWLLVDDARGFVGVALPQAVNEKTGTLYYVGVAPARRGAGLGRALHAYGLRALAAHGLVTYVGSTDVRNVAMRRVFAANACPETGTESYFAGPSSP